MLTLDDYNEQILKPMIKQRFADAMANEIKLIEEMCQTAIFYGWKPPTRKQRIKRWIEDKKQRARNIWTILSGGDIHENCGY